MPRTRPHPAYFIVAGIFLTIVVLGAGMALDGDDASSEPEPFDERLLATAVPPTPIPTPEPTPEPAPTPEPDPTLPDRTVCAEISGTPYRSDAERAFFLASCFLSQLESAPWFTVPA
jgi:hypothetical protein